MLYSVFVNVCVSLKRHNLQEKLPQYLLATRLEQVKEGVLVVCFV
jgi:hypothetical protein